MNKLNKAFIYIIILIGLFAPLYVQASHVIGADIAWKSLGNDSFEIIVHGYRDCNGILLSATNLTYFTSGDTCAPNPVDAKPSICCGTDITPICNNSCDRCQSNTCSFAYGIQEFTITATIYLSSPCCNYTIAWQESSRSSAITTGAAGQNFYLDAHLNRCIKPAISSPYFSEPPLTIFCVNQCTVLNSGIVDNSVDSAGRPDSLSYSLGSPQSGPGQNIGYNAPYTYEAPLIYAGKSKDQPFIPPYCYGFHLDSITGDIEFKATKQDITVYVLMIDIYRRDSAGIERIVGETKRDLEIIAINCPQNRPPIIPGINGGSAFSINVCAGQQACFNVDAFDLDASDTDKITWKDPGTMKGATFTVTSASKKWPVAQFCWTPQKTDASPKPYIFIAKATDNICPIPGSASKAFSIYVGAAPTASYSATVQKCGLVTFQADVAINSPSPIFSYVWTGDSASGSKPLYIKGKSGTYQYNAQRKFYYTLTVTGLAGCSKSYKDSIIIPKIPELKIPKDTGLCSGAKLTITAIPSNYTNPYTITWNTGDTGTHISPNITKDTVLVAGIKDASGCTAYDTMKIKVFSLPVANIAASQAICYGRTILIGDSAVKGDMYSWTSHPPGFLSFISNPNVSPIITTNYILKETNMSGCSIIDSVTISVNPLPAANTGPNLRICKGSQAKLGAKPIPGNKYDWTSSPEGFHSKLAQPDVIPDTTTVYYLTEAVVATRCYKTDSVIVTVVNSSATNAHWSMNYSGDEAWFHAADTSLPNSSYYWSFGDGGSGTGHNIKHLYPQNSTYSVSLIVAGNNGCTIKNDSIVKITLSNIKTTETDNYQITIYPNPFNSSATLQYTLIKPSKITIGLFDMTGRQIAIIKNENQEAGGYNAEINAEKYHLSPGVYLLKFVTDDGFVNRQVVKL